ncbi:MAG: hypothetical protein R6U96_12445 [Promethearchaeia archaeon]
MGKEKPKLKVKTSRYFTKACNKCKKEYPNWFTNCPYCGTPWHAESTQENRVLQQKEKKKKKTIKIVVKIAEDDFDEGIVKVQLIFSADKGQSWYKLDMDSKRDYYIAEIAEVPIHSVIIYYMEVFLENGEKIIENNEGQYYFYEVGGPIKKEPERKPSLESKPVQRSHENLQTQKSEYQEEPGRESTQSNEQSTTQEMKTVSNPQTQKQTKTIFGTPQVKKETNLKVCPYCDSKIKKMWQTCPICGNKIE